ncbi:dihydropteroate synthase [bacterium]|nr:dihydropteroate synthase [bacterium]
MCADETKKWWCRDRGLSLDHTLIMGILNVTPDSFSDGGRYLQIDRAVAQGLRLLEEGADILDIGGESTRPGSLPVDEREEARRVIPVIRELSRRTAVPLSIDTYKSEIARQALDQGACVVNDISGLTFDPRMAEVIAQAQAGLVIMHMKGRPRDMQLEPFYVDVVQEVRAFLRNQKEAALAAGILENRIVVDPGIGFGKRQQDNLTLLCRLDQLNLGSPILVGPSRKSFIGAILNLPPEERLHGTAAAVTAAVLQGADLVRVHDVKEMKQTVAVAEALRRYRDGLSQAG